LTFRSVWFRRQAWARRRERDQSVVTRGVAPSMCRPPTRWRRPARSADGISRAEPGGQPDVRAAARTAARPPG